MHKSYNVSQNLAGYSTDLVLQPKDSLSVDVIHISLVQVFNLKISDALRHMVIISAK